MGLGNHKGAHQSAHVTISSGYSLRGIRALVLVGGRDGAERFGDSPLALLDVLGRSVLMRTLDRLRAAGIGEIAVLSDTGLPPHPTTASCKFSVASPESFWDDALHRFRRLARRSESVLVIRLGAWAEVDYAEMIDDHRQSGAAVMRACSGRGEALDIFAVSSINQSEAAALLRGELRDNRLRAAVHITDRYVNMLTEPASLRSLTLDAFACDSEIRPCGRELRPGVWVGKGARIHRRSRIVAPAFIGNYCNVHSAAVITRGSSVEHHAVVDCGTVIDNSNVIAHTRVGAGLDVEYSVVGFKQVYSMQRNVTVEVSDPRLIGTAGSHLSARALAAGRLLFHQLPSTLLQWIFADDSKPEPIQTETSKAVGVNKNALTEASIAPIDSQTKSYTEMAATRRYGNE